MRPRSEAAEQDRCAVFSDLAPRNHRKRGNDHRRLDLWGAHLLIVEKYARFRPEFRGFLNVDLPNGSPGQDQRCHVSDFSVENR